MTKIPILAKQLGVTTAAVYKWLQEPEIAPFVVVNENGRKALNDEGVALLKARCQSFSTVDNELTTKINTLTTENEALKNQLSQLQSKYTEVLEESREQAIRDKERYAELLAIIAQNNQPPAIEDKTDEEKPMGFFGRFFGRGKPKSG
jgi:predicted RNase H-like nuclease (RuvC/YqgF family)